MIEIDCSLHLFDIFSCLLLNQIVFVLSVALLLYDVNSSVKNLSFALLPLHPVLVDLEAYNHKSVCQQILHFG